MEKLIINLKDISNLLSFDSRGTSVNKELEKFLLIHVIPILKTNVDMIESVIKDLNHNIVLLYLMVREIPMTQDLLIYSAGHFFDQVEYKNGVNSHVQKLMEKSITEDDFVSFLLRQVQSLEETLTKEKGKELVEKLFSLNQGNAWRWIAPAILKAKMIDLETIITMTIASRYYYNPKKVEHYPTGFHSMMLDVISDHCKKIKITETLIEGLVKNYFDEKLLFDSNGDWLKMTKLLLKEFRLKKEQILHLKKQTMDHWYVRSIVVGEFCNLVFNHQSSISPLEVKKWLNGYLKSEQEKESSKSQRGSNFTSYNGIQH